MKELIKLRRSIKAKKPNFRRQDSHKKKRVNPRWRKPKGIQSKMRLGLKGYCKIVKNGYGSPKEIKNLSKEGLIRVLVANVKDIKEIDNKTQGIIISSKVGNKKKLDVIKAAKEKQITILNIKYPEKCVKKIEESIKKRKETKGQKEKEKQEKTKKEEEAKKARSEEKNKLESKVEKEISEKENKIKEKKERDKLLISKSEPQ